MKQCALYNFFLGERINCDEGPTDDDSHESTPWVHIEGHDVVHGCHLCVVLTALNEIVLFFVLCQISPRHSLLEFVLDDVYI